MPLRLQLMKKEEGPPAVDVPVYETYEEMELDLNFQENELDYEAVIQPEEYPIQADEWAEQQQNDSSPPCLYPRGGAEDLSSNPPPAIDETPEGQEE